MKSRIVVYGLLAFAIVAVAIWTIVDRSAGTSASVAVENSSQNYADQSKIALLEPGLKPRQVEELLGGTLSRLDVGDFGKSSDSLLSLDLSKNERLEMTFEKVTTGFSSRGPRIEYRLYAWQVVPIPATPDEIEARGTKIPRPNFPERLVPTPDQ